MGGDYARNNDREERSLVLLFIILSTSGLWRYMETAHGWLWFRRVLCDVCILIRWRHPVLLSKPPPALDPKLHHQ